MKSLPRLVLPLRAAQVIRSSKFPASYTASRSISSSLARTADGPSFSSNPPQGVRTLDTHPADVVAGDIPGPLTEVLDGDEITAETVSDAPPALLHRTVRIFKPSKSTMQSAKGKTHRWALDWDVLQGAGRWTNPLMGWASSADYMQGTTMFFKTEEEAVAFAQKQGWAYYVAKPGESRIPPKNYASNYVHVPGKLRIHHTK